MSWSSRFLGGGKQPSAEPVLTDVQRFAVEQATNLMHIINESLLLSNNATNSETKVSRLELARSKLDSLELLSLQHPFIKLQRLEKVKTTMSDLASQYGDAGYCTQTEPSCRDYQQNVWRNSDTQNGDLIKGWRFIATIQLRTPFRVLSRHGETHEGLTDPPKIANEQWEGYWTTVLKSNKELGIDIPEVIVGGKTTASDIGQIPIDGGDYLTFLLELQKIVEKTEAVESRKAMLSMELSRPKYASFLRKLGGKKVIASKYFPAFLERIPKLSPESVEALRRCELTTPARITAAPDAVLLGMKGIGPTKLKIIRETCQSAFNKQSELLDAVVS